MDGVTILNTIECGGFDGIMLFLAILFGIVALIAIVLAIAMICDGDILDVVMIAIIGAVLAALCILFITRINTPKYNEYQVAVDDTVNFNEFQKKYKIVDQNGDLYTVVERSEE